jgi:hypothetical protein
VRSITGADVVSMSAEAANGRFSNFSTVNIAFAVQSIE